MKKNNRKKRIDKDDAINNFLTTTAGKKYIKRFAKNNQMPEKDAADTLKLILDSNTGRKSFNGKTEASKELSNIADTVVLTKDEQEWKQAKAEAKNNLNFDFDFRKLNGKKAPKKVRVDDKELNPEDLVSTMNMKSVTVNGYYDLGNNLVVLTLLVAGDHGSPIQTSVLASADILQKLQ